MQRREVWRVAMVEQKKKEEKEKDLIFVDWNGGKVQRGFLPLG